MLNPGSTPFRIAQSAAVNGNMIGERRPWGRVTIGKNVVKGHRSQRPGIWRDILFDGPRQVEIFGIQSITISRSLEQDAASCTIVMTNDALDSGVVPTGMDHMGRPGYFSPGRGVVSTAPRRSVYERWVPDEEDDDWWDRFPTEWDVHQPGAAREPGYAQRFYAPTPDIRYYGGSGAAGGPTSPWLKNLMLPNRLVRTYQGYGSDNFDEMHEPYHSSDTRYVAPHEDRKMVQTGIWLIDRIIVGNDGQLTMECRDLSKLLIEQFIYPDNTGGMVPMSRWPLVYRPTEAAKSRQPERYGRDVLASIGAPGSEFATSSEAFGKAENEAIYGHRPSHALDDRPDNYWLSMRYSDRSGPQVFPFITAQTSRRRVDGNVYKAKINEVVVNTVGSDYVCYISVHEDGAWQGTQTIPYTPPGTNDSGANIPYVKRVVIPSTAPMAVRLGRVYNADYVRLTFSKLYHFKKLDASGHYRVGVQGFRARFVRAPIKASPSVRFGEIDPDRKGDGMAINDWSQAVKELCGWAGFTWLARREFYGNDIKEDAVTGRAVPKRRNRPGIGVATLTSDMTPTSLSFVIDPGANAAKWKRLAGKGSVPFVLKVGAEKILCRSYNPQSGKVEVVPGRYGYYSEAGRGYDETGATSHVTGAPVRHLIDNPYGIALRVWGDFEWLGVPPNYPTKKDEFLNISFKEAIDKIREWIGANFWVDESGGAVFRMPNIYTGGNFISDIDEKRGLNYSKRWPIEFHENANLIDYKVVIDDSEIRSEVMVIGGRKPERNLFGRVLARGNNNETAMGGYVLADSALDREEPSVDFGDVLAGQTRLMQIPRDMTEGFTSDIECQRMAELTTLAMFFTYRRGQASIVGHPGLQLDDQVIIYERMTAERSIHYVSSIESVMELDTGSWTMDVTTHWLGSNPETQDWLAKKFGPTPAINSIPAVKRRLGEV